MENKMYPVFCLDLSFQPYELQDHFIAADSELDLFNHLLEIFPGTTYVVEREDWMTDEDWEETLEDEGCEEGTVKHNPEISDKQMDEIKESLNDQRFPRIKKIDGLFSDQKYKILFTESYFE